jgi:hypothetical protein
MHEPHPYPNSPDEIRRIKQESKTASAPQPPSEGDALEVQIGKLRKWRGVASNSEMLRLIDGLHALIPAHDAAVRAATEAAVLGAAVEACDEIDWYKFRDAQPDIDMNWCNYAAGVIMSRILALRAAPIERLEERKS